METLSVPHRLVTVPMIRFFFVLLAALAFVEGSAEIVHAAPAITHCQLQFEAKGTDIQVLVGYSKLKGRGQIVCVAPDSRRENLAIKIQIGTPIIFPRVSFAPSLSVHGASGDIQVLKGGPRAILGRYLTVDIRAALGDGFASTLALQGENNGLTFELGLDDVEGFGIAVGGTVVQIEAL